MTAVPPAPGRTPTVAVVIVAWNSARTIDAALAPLEPAHREGWLRCVVVDNASADGTLAHVRERHPWAETVAAGANLGFGRGCNLGARTGTSDYLLFLNPDAAIEPAAVRTLVAFLEGRPEAGIAGPAVVAGDRVPDATALPTPGSILRRAAGLPGAHRGRRPVAAGGEPFRTEWVSGGALFVSRSLFESLGGFDPAYFLYFEDSDLCRRAIDAGREVWLVGTAIARHAAGSSARSARRPMYAGCIAEHYFRSRYHYLARHHGRAAAAATEALEWVALACAALFRRLRGRPLEEIPVRLRTPLFRRPVHPPPAA